MSQYLSHLANLAFNRLDVVQPRLSSRFESRDDNSVAGLDLHDAMVDSPAPTFHHTAEPSATRGDTPQAADITADQRSMQPSTKPASENVRSVEQIARQTIHPVESRSPHVQPDVMASNPIKITTPAENSFKEEHLETHLPLLRPAVTKPAVALQHNPERQQASNFFLQDRAEMRVFAEKSRGSESPDIEHRQADSAERKSEPVSKSAPIKPDTIRVKPLQPEFHRDVQQAKLPLATAPVEITPPSITVSIGRIEIRASQTNAPVAAKARPATNTMSLDDYLKQRNGERS